MPRFSDAFEDLRQFTEALKEEIRWRELVAYKDAELTREIFAAAAARGIDYQAMMEAPCVGSH